jgi:HK97 family phage major capsid protein
VDELIRKLEERRAKLADRAAELLNLAAGRETLSNTTEELAEYDQITGKDLAEIDGQLKRMRDQRDREVRAAAARAGDPAPVDGSATPSGVQVTSEPMVYGQHSGHSYFLDQARVHFRKGDSDGGWAEAQQRQERHQAELRVEMPKRVEKRRKEADARIESALSGEGYGTSPREQRRARLERRTYERFLAAGGKVYEQRIISRTDGQGGYEVPPLWLVDEYIEYLRAGRTLADLWHNFPLPSGTDSINIPRFVTGTATGTQPGDGAPVPGRDAADNFVQARVMTVAGQEDAAMQLLDQSPLNYDEIIFADLAADYNMQVSAQLMLGSGFPQLNGLFPTGVLGASVGASTTGFVTQATGTTTAQWTGTASFYTGIAQLISQIARNRFLTPTAIITNPAVWYALTSAIDSQNRPLVVPEQNGPFNAVEVNGGAQAEGLVGRVQSLPWYVDPNIPLTFGGTVAPYIGAISNGHTAPVPGSGGNPLFTPAIVGRFADLFFWEGDMRTRVLSEVLSGSLAVRFQLYAYCASMPNRYQDASGNLLSYGNVNSGTTQGAALSQGTSGGLVGF